MRCKSRVFFGAVALLPSSFIIAAPTPYQAAVLANNPVVYYTMDDTSGTSATNLGSAAGTYGGTYTNVQLGVTSAFPGLGTAGGFGAGGNSSSIDLLANISDVLNGSASMDFWIQTSQTNGANNGWQDPAVAGRDSAGNESDIQWGAVPSPGDIGITTGNNHANALASAQADGNWHYFLLSRDSTTGNINVYEDGVVTPVASVTGAAGSFSAVYSQIGRSESVLTANLDEVAVYGQVLTGAQGAAHYAAALPEPASLGILGMSAMGLMARRRKV